MTLSPKTPLIALSCCVLLFANPSFASLTQTFRLDTSGTGGIVPPTLDREISGDPFVFSATGLVADGVSFDVNLTLDASASLNNNGGGVGIGTNLINDTEFIDFSVAITSTTNGTVNFDGFTEIRLTSFDVNNTSDIASVVDISPSGSGSTQIVSNSANSSFDFSLPTTPSLLTDMRVLGQTATTGGGTSFRIETIDLQFTGTAAVPEPTPFVFVGMAVVLGLGARRYRRPRSQQPQR